MVDCPSCKYYENGECRPTIFPPDECDDYEESFEHHWEMMDDIEREEYNALWAESEDKE